MCFSWKPAAESGICVHFLGGLNPVKPVLMLMELNGVSTFQLAKYNLDGVGRGVYPCLCRNFKGNWGRKYPNLQCLTKPNLILTWLHPWFHDEKTWAKNHITILKLTEFRSFFEHSFPKYTDTHPGWGGFGIPSTFGGLFSDRPLVLEYQKSSFCDPSQSCPNLGEWWWLSISLPFLISIIFLFVCNLGFFL